jgi:diaminopimelate epimerase
MSLKIFISLSANEFYTMNIEFYKYQGTGNDFVLLDNRNKQYDALTTKQVKHLCNRHFGIGADGLMLLNLLDGYDFEMKYYNADGHESSMCGNGGRCIVRFAYDLGMDVPEYHFLAIDGPHLANIDDHKWVQLKMKDVRKVSLHRGDLILDTGSPHYIRLVSDVMTLDVVDEGRRIRYSDDFEKKGINVNFVEQSNDYITVRTYERGVEDETLSCGTGVTASALISAHNEFGFNRIEVKTKGGHLAVEFDKTGDEHFENIWLCGPATRVFKGELTLRDS